MLVERKKLTEHLSHLNCGGLLKDVILTDRFKAAGFSINQDLLVVTQGLDKADPLPAELGVVNLELLIRSLGIGDDEKVSFDIDGPHLILQSSDRKISLVTAAARVIGSRADEHMVDKLLKPLTGALPWAKLGLRIVTGIQEGIQILAAEHVIFHVTPKGTRIVVGESAANSIEFNFPELKYETEYQLMFHAGLISPVLKQITDFTKAEMLLTGPESVVPIREGNYMYVMSPAKAV